MTTKFIYTLGKFNSTLYSPQSYRIQHLDLLVALLPQLFWVALERRHESYQIL